MEKKENKKHIPAAGSFVKETVLDNGTVKREYVRDDGRKVEEIDRDGYTQRIFPLGTDSWTSYLIPDYLESPEKTAEYIQERKKDLKQYILNCRNLTADELATKKVAEEIKKGWINSSNKESIAKTTEYYKREIVRDKAKYKGITDEEIDEYVDLAIRKELLSHLLNIKGVENGLWASKNISRSYGDHRIHGRDIYSIRDITKLDEQYKEERDEAREDLKKGALIIGGIEGAVVTGLGVVTSAVGGAFTLEACISSILLGGVGFAFGCGLVSVLFGVPQLVRFLIKKLQNKKFVEELKKNGTYDLALEYTERLQRMQELEKKDGKGKKHGLK